jgi:hypothetical protein
MPNSSWQQTTLQRALPLACTRLREGFGHDNRFWTKISSLQCLLELGKKSRGRWPENGTTRPIRSVTCVSLRHRRLSTPTPTLLSLDACSFHCRMHCQFFSLLLQLFRLLSCASLVSWTWKRLDSRRIERAARCLVSQQSISQIMHGCLSCWMVESGAVPGRSM